MNSKKDFNYSGSAIQFALLFYGTFLLSIITFGLYYPWGATSRRRYIWSHTGFDSDASTYTGTGKELAKGWVQLILVFFVLGTIISTGLELFGIPGIILSSIFQLLIYAFVASNSLYGGLRYKLNRTVWRGIRFGLERNKQLSKEFFRICVKGIFLSFITFGFYYPFFRHHQLNFLYNKISLGNCKFQYTGDAKKLAALYYRGMFFNILTLGIYFPWFIKSISVYRFNHTHVAGNTFQFEAKTSNIFFYGICSYLLAIVSFGLAAPFIQHWWMKIFINGLSLQGEAIAFENIQQQQNNLETSTFGDAIGDNYDVDFGIF